MKNLGIWAIRHSGRVVSTWVFFDGDYNCSTAPKIQIMWDIGGRFGKCMKCTTENILRKFTCVTLGDIYSSALKMGLQRGSSSTGFGAFHRIRGIQISVFTSLNLVASWVKHLTFIYNLSSLQNPSRNHSELWSSQTLSQVHLCAFQDTAVDRVINLWQGQINKPCYWKPQNFISARTPWHSYEECMFLEMKIKPFLPWVLWGV